MIESRYFDSAGVPIRYVHAGDGEPVVLVHSYSSDVDDMWMRTGILAALAKHYRAMAFDARGHGRSGKPHDPNAYGAELAWDVARLLDHLGIRKAHVIGYSMGAHIVAQLLTLAPDRFLSATLGGGSGRRRWTDAHERQAQIEAAEMEQGRLDTQIRRLWPTGKAPASDEEIGAMAAQWLAGKDTLALAAVRRSNPRQVVSAADMARAAVPVLGLVGSEDPYLASYDELSACMPRLRLVVLDGATHASGPEHGEFIPALEAFLREHSSGRQ